MSQSIKGMLERAQPGSNRAVRDHIRRAEAIAAAISRRWGPQHRSPYRWRQKHVRWYLQHGCAELAASTQYDHWRTVRVLLGVTGRLEDWKPRLLGPWCYKTGKRGSGQGGRPPKLAFITTTK